ncbi:MAG: nuclear transport factor 2 family protein [Haliscomenobacter sp.]|nr:nuclear transport factor 2 family protein [Haliscomenobacter sp.]
MQHLKETVRILRRVLTAGGTANSPNNVSGALADGFESRNAAGTKSKEALIAQINGFWKLMPDMRWEIQDIVQEGNRVVAGK